MMQGAGACCPTRRGDCLPAAPFDSEEALAALTRLGMRSSIGPDSILQSAWYIAELGLRDLDQAHDR